MPLPMIARLSERPLLADGAMGPAPVASSLLGVCFGSLDTYVSRGGRDAQIP